MGNLQNSENYRKRLENKVMEVSASFSVPIRIGQIQAWEKFEKSASRSTYEANVIRLDFSTYLKIAASVIIFLTASYTLFILQDVAISTASAEHKIIELPDHSMVSLNAGSTISYNNWGFYLIRKVKFTGEGFFKVQKGSSFEVISGNGSTKVLGTQFNVLARGNRYEVACVEGKVKVSTKRSSTILTAGISTALSDKNKLIPPKAFRDDVVAWQNGEFYFESALLKDVLGTLELQYNIKVHYENDLSSRIYTGYFTNQNLDEALKLVCLPLGLTYSINHKEVKISTNK